MNKSDLAPRKNACDSPDAFEYRFSGFGDEISPNIEEQLEVMASEGIRFLEIRGAEDKNVLDFTDGDMASIKGCLDRMGFGISAIGSPIGKTGIKGDFKKHLKDFEKIIKIARYFGTKYIRIFSYYIPEGEDPARYRDPVLERMKTKADIAKQEGVILLHENEKGIYGNTASRCRDILETINSPNLRLTFDPANFVEENERPFRDSFPLLEKYIEYMHIKDKRFSDKVVTPAGEGDGEIEEILKALKKRGYNGFLSLEPHLSIAGKSSGFSGPDKFRLAVNALKKILDRI